MDIAKLTDDEKKYLESEEKGNFKLQKYEVSTPSLRWCDSRGIKPVVFFAFSQIECDEDDDRNLEDVIEDPRFSYLEKVRVVLIELRKQQRVIVPHAFRSYLTYLEKIKSQERARLLSDL